MQTSRFLYWGAQLGGWLTYALLLILATYAEDETGAENTHLDQNFWISLLMLIALGLLITHGMRWLLLRWNWLRLSFAPLIPRVVLLSLFCATVLTFCDLAFSSLLSNFHKELYTPLHLLINMLALTLLMLLWNAIYFTYHFFRQSIKQELNNLQLQSSQQEIELKNLRSQLNPHFLFNSLNSIRALIDIEPASAKESVTTLSNLLRKSLILGKHSFISLKEELEIVRSYLELEKIRFEERLEIEWELASGIDEFQVPPFLLQTQAENAIKHGISKLIEGGQIKVRTAVEKDGTLVMRIENSGQLGKNPDTGIGIENTLRRLDLQYRGKARFELKEVAGKVCCTIEIKA
jgi:two-component system LytT family sensor kinase